ncbi:MAG: hypothetical protein QMC24_11780 [Akkermansiaceae bacterium]
MKLFFPFLLTGLAFAGPDDYFSSIEESSSDAEDSGSFLDRVFTGIQRVDQDFDLLDDSDVSVWRSTFAYRQERSRWNIEANVGFTDISIDYSDPVGGTSATNRREDSWSGGLILGTDLSEDLSFTFGFSHYEGFNNYASLWISEYYDQFVGIPDPTNYNPADPSGSTLSGNLIWDYDPGVARLTLSFSYGNDEIVPAWSLVPNPSNFFMPEATPTRSSFDTYTGSVAWAKALSPSLRNQTTFRFSEVTELNPRFQLQNDTAWAISDELTLRAQTGASFQHPDFEAFYGGLSLVYDLNVNWSVGVSARVYDDTGEIVPVGFNTAAPAITSTEFSASLAWQKLSTTVRISAGIYDVDYGPLGPSNQFFADLYRDRSFLVTRLALTYTF